MSRGLYIVIVVVWELFFLGFGSFAMMAPSGMRDIQLVVWLFFVLVPPPVGYVLFFKVIPWMSRGSRSAESETKR